MNPSFFVVGLPRSGTTWLSRLIAKQNPSTHIVHEPYKKPDFEMDRLACFEPWRADAYMERRHGLIQTRLEGREAVGYGEITPRVRYFASSLQRFYPDAKFVHLVRDPIKSVMSLMNFGYYDKHGRVHRVVAPDKGKWSQVKRAAWAWSFGHHRIRQTVPTFYRFEDLLTDHNFVQSLADELGMEVNKDVWEFKKNQPVNVSRRTHPEYEDWTEQEREEFHEMTDEEASRYGYA